MREVLFVIFCIFVGTYAHNAALKWNHLQTIGTHNSYHARAYPLITTWSYFHPNMSVQLEKGIRHFELDLHWPRGTVMHLDIYDNAVMCHSLGHCLDYHLKTWREVNPNHPPLFIQIEIKSGPMTIRDWKEYDEEIIAVVKRKNLFTPDDLRKELGADHSTSLRELILTKGWPTLDSARGKFVIILHGNQPNYTQYEFSGLKDRTSFMSHTLDDSNLENAAFLHDDRPDINGERIKELVQQGFIIRTRADCNYFHVDPENPPTTASLREEVYKLFDRNSDEKVSKEEVQDFFVWIPKLTLKDARRVVKSLFNSCNIEGDIVELKEHWDCMTEKMKSLGIPEQVIPNKEETINQREKAFESGAQFVSTDYFLEPEHKDDYWVRMPNGIKTPYRCNPITTKNIDCSNHDFEVAPDVHLHDETPSLETPTEEPTEVPQENVEPQETDESKQPATEKKRDEL